MKFNVPYRTRISMEEIGWKEIFFSRVNITYKRSYIKYIYISSTVSVIVIHANISSDQYINDATPKCRLMTRKVKQNLNFKKIYIFILRMDSKMT